MLQEASNSSRKKGKWVEMSRMLFFRHLSEKDLGAFADLLLGQVLLVRGDHPRVAKGVFDRARAISPEHIGHRHHFYSPGFDGLFERRIRVRHVDVETDR